MTPAPWSREASCCSAPRRRWGQQRCCPRPKALSLGCPSRARPGTDRFEGASPPGAPRLSGPAARSSADPERPGVRPEPTSPFSPSRRSFSGRSHRFGPVAGTFRMGKAGGKEGAERETAGSGRPGGPARAGDAAPCPPVCPVSSAALPACVNHLPTVHRAGEDQQGVAAAFTGRQSSKFPFLLQKLYKERPRKILFRSPLVSEEQPPATVATRGN